MTLSRLRRAIANASATGVERYLRCGSHVELVLEHVEIDARRFAEYVEWGQLDEGRGDYERARHWYVEAERLYADHLLASQAVELPLAGRVVEFALRLQCTLSRLVDLALRANDLEEVHSYERRALAFRMFALTSGTA